MERKVGHVGTGTVDGTGVGFWVIFPVVGLLICLFFVIAMVRMMEPVAAASCA